MKRVDVVGGEVTRGAGGPFELHGGGRFAMARQNFVPAYLATYESGRLQEKVEQAVEMLRRCEVCPRHCRVNRLANQQAACHSGRSARVSSAFTHFGEEDCLRGRRGSGTIFFAWCNLRCVFCQIMDQYHPAWRARRDPKFVEINRGITEDEFEQALDCARRPVSGGSTAAGANRGRGLGGWTSRPARRREPSRDQG